MNRRQFEQGCRDIAKRLGRKPVVQPYKGSLYEYVDLRLSISSRENGPYLLVRALDVSLRKPVIETRDGKVCFSKHWRRYADHVARLTVLDQLAQL